MNPSIKNSLLCTFALATGILGVLIFQQRQQLHELEQQASSVSAERDAAKKHLAETEQRVATAEKDHADLEAELKALRARPAAAPASARAFNPAAAMAALDNPAMQKIMASSMKSGLDQRYAALFKKLKLSPADLDKFKDLLTEKQMSGLDVVRVSQAQRGDPREIGALMSKVQGEMDDSIHALLGDEGFTQFQEFNQNIGSYGLLDQVERRLSYTNAPLQDAQSEALLRVLKDTTESRFPGGAPGGNAMAGFAQGMVGANPMMAAMTQPHITDQTIAAAQGVLSDGQIEVLRQLQSEQQNQLNAMKSLRGAAGQPGPAAATPAMPAPLPPGAAPASEPIRP